MIRLIIADDHEVVRQGLQRIVANQPDMEVVAEAGDADELLRLLETTEGDVLLLDISMPGPGFLEVMERVREGWSRLAVLVLSVHSEEHWAVRALQAGAAGFLTKGHQADELIEAIRRISQGRRYVTAALAEQLAELVGPEPSGEAHERLSHREFQVLCALGGGQSVKAIARELDLSHRTVSTYRARVLQKLGLESTAELIRYVIEHDLQG